MEYKIKIFSSKEDFFEVLWKNGRLVDETVFQRIRFFSPYDFDWLQDRVNAFFVTAFDNDKLIAVAKVGYFNLSAPNENTYSISFFSVDIEYRNQGLSRLMCECLFAYAKSKHYEISTSTYTVIGKRFLQPLFNEYAKKYDITFHDRKQSDYLNDTEEHYSPYKNTFIHKLEAEKLK